MKRKIASTLCALGVAVTICAQNSNNVALTNKKDSIYYAKSFLSFNKQEYAKEVKDLSKYSDIFINTMNSTYEGLSKGQTEKEIKEGLYKKYQGHDEYKDALESGLMIGALCYAEGDRAKIFTQAMIDKISGKSSFGWSEENMIQFVKQEEAQRAAEAAQKERKKKEERDQSWNTLIKGGYTELATKDEGIASGLAYEGRGVLMKTEKVGKGDRIKLKDVATISFTLDLLDGTAICAGKKVEVTPDNVINGLCAALLEMKEETKATIYIPEGLGYRDDIVFSNDPLRADWDKVVNKPLKMGIEVLSIKRK